MPSDIISQIMSVQCMYIINQQSFFFSPIYYCSIKLSFFYYQPDVGLVTATGGTLIANGVTTVHTTRVFGTYLNGGNYAQVVQSTAKVKSLNSSKQF